MAHGYVEPSRRPTDGRYGENPNRLQHYYQFQVILKPSPDNVQELYLESLGALGIDPAAHDIRFVEDDWESPTLGAWGLGWEVWLNGMEVTQFTYFQQVGGIDLAPVSVELTYGLERLCMYLQEKESVYDLSWNGEVTYGHVHHQNEVEQSRYNFELSNAPCSWSCSGATRPNAWPVRGRQPGRLRLLPEVLAYLQPARRARGHLHHRAHRLHRPGAQSGLQNRRLYAAQREEMGHPMLAR